jgi:hypothetical protein
MADYSGNQTKQINALGGQNSEFLGVEPGGSENNNRSGEIRYK